MINLFSTEMLRKFNGERIIFSTSVVGQLDIYIEKNEVRPLSLARYKNELQMNQSPKCKN